MRCSGSKSLTKSHPSKVIASDTFVGYCGGKWILLGTEKLRGFEQAVKIFAPDTARVKGKGLELTPRTGRGWNV